MRYVVCDFETASRRDLIKSGSFVYASDFSTFILTFSLKVIETNKSPKLIILTEKELLALDSRLMELINDTETIFVAHNCSFEMAIWKYQMEPMGYPPLEINRWHDTMAVAAMKGLPLGLDPLGRALNLPIKKDTEGHRLMLRMCKPTQDGLWLHSQDNMERLKEYNVIDCETQYAAHVRLKGLGPSEREIWKLDQKINQRGIKIDRKFVDACQDVLEQVRKPMTERFKSLTGGVNPTQRSKIVEWVGSQGVGLSDVKRATIDAILDPGEGFGLEDLSEPLPANVHEVLTLRRSLASTSVSKLQRMKDCAMYNDRVYYTMQYHGARTGRESGRLIQIQNYPRGSIQSRPGLTPEILADAILTKDVTFIKSLWGEDVFDAVISSLRSCIIPEKGHILVAGDYAQIEARIALSLAGEHGKAQMLADGIDVYCEMASDIFKYPVNKKDHPRERQIGKNSVLGLQFGLGAVGFKNKMAPNESIDLALLAVNTYRKSFAPLIPKLWYGLDNAATQAVWCNSAKAYSFRGIEFQRTSEFLTMRLPSGRKIYYHQPEKILGKWPSGDDKPGWTAMSYQGNKFRRREMWYGEITNNVVQGSARDIMMFAAVNCEKENLPIIFKVHDELVAEVKQAPDLDVKLKQVMEHLPPWAYENKFQLSAEVETMMRYRK